MPKLFTTLSERYASRPGGYTRIHKFGRRPGDNAPHAIVELVDGPRDLRFEMVARAVGREVAQAGAAAPAGVVFEGEAGKEELEGVLRERTKLGLDKVLRYRGETGRKNFMDKAKAWEVGSIPCDHATRLGQMLMLVKEHASSRGECCGWTSSCQGGTGGEESVREGSRGESFRRKTTSCRRAHGGYERRAYWIGLGQGSAGQESSSRGGQDTALPRRGGGSTGVT